MREQISRNLKVSVTGLVAVIFLVYLLLNTEKFEPLLRVNGYLVFLAGLGYVAGVFTNGIFIKFILQPFKKVIPVAEAFYVSVISSIGNFFAPAGTGFGIRAVYLKKKHGLAYSDFISTLSGNYVLVFLVSSLAGLLSLLTLWQNYGIQWLLLFAFFLVMFIASLLISLFKFRLDEPISSKGNWVGTLRRNLYRVVNGWSKIVSNRELMLRLFGLTCVNLILTIFIYWAIIHSVGLGTSLSALVLLSVLGTLSIFINITPANLGVKEAVYIFSASVLGFSVSEIVLIALVDRGVQFTVLLVLWLFASRSHLKNKLAQ